MTGPGYQHSETQRWQVSGPTSDPRELPVRPFALDGHRQRLLPADAGDQTRNITWTVKAAAQGQFQFVVRASDNKLLIGQANAQLRVPNGITGTQQVTIGGVPQTPGPVGLEAFETQLPPIVAAKTSHRVSGSTAPTVIHGSFGPFQPATATVTKRCSWRFAKAG